MKLHNHQIELTPCTAHAPGSHVLCLNINGCHHMQIKVTGRLFYILPVEFTLRLTLTSRSENAQSIHN